jgi:hypothetical protein
MAYFDKSPDEARARQAKKEDKRENAAIAKAEAMLAKMMREGKVNPGNIRKIKEEIARKTGAYPLGATN